MPMEKLRSGQQWPAAGGVKNPRLFASLACWKAAVFMLRAHNNNEHRLVYQVLAEPQIVKVLRMWSHTE